jgi:hypothetical protein
MPIPKSDLGIYGEHVLADDHGMIAAEGDGPEAMSFAVDPTSPQSPIWYHDWDHYYAVCVTAATRAANLAKLAAEDAAVR